MRPKLRVWACGCLCPQAFGGWGEGTWEKRRSKKRRCSEGGFDLNFEDVKATKGGIFLNIMILLNKVARKKYKYKKAPKPCQTSAMRRGNLRTNRITRCQRG